jgi:hypothetical protein
MRRIIDAPQGNTKGVKQTVRLRELANDQLELQ